MIDLRLGDCLGVMPELPAQSVHAIITDLPYGTTACAWDSVIPFGPMWAEVKRLLKPHGVFVTTASQPFTSALVMSNVEWFRYAWVWEKTRPSGYLDANKRPMRSHEDVCVFSNGNSYNPQIEKGGEHKRGAVTRHKGQAKCYGKHARINNATSHDYYPQTVIRFGMDKETTVTRGQRPFKIERHPTQKPVALYEYLVRTYTNEGDTVLDLCAGSGTTGVACVRAGRNFIGIEMDQVYFSIMQKRVAEAQMQWALL